MLAQQCVPIIWIGAGYDADVNRRLAAIHGIDATDTFSIAQIAEIARKARFALANDSGPMHAMAAAEIPVFGFFGPSAWRRNHALGQATRVLADSSLAQISAQTVIDRLQNDGLLPLPA